MHSIVSTAVSGRANGAIAVLAALIFVLTGGFFQDAAAQRTVVIESGEYGELNRTIEGDTTATGERVDPNTVYVLKRNTTYWLEGSLQNPGYHLRLEAEEGEGHPPIMRPGVDITGSSARLFVIRGDFTISGIYTSNLDEFGAKQQQLFRVTGDSVRIVIDNVWGEWDRQSIVSTQTHGNSIFITDSKFRNVGIRTSVGNGRIIDTRGNNQDSIVVKNSTFYAFVNRPYLGGDAVVNYMEWDHVTMVDMGQFWDGARVIEQIITNSLWVNVDYRATGPPDLVEDPEAEVRGFFRIDSMLAMQDVSDLDRNLVWRNNIFYRDQELIDIAADSGLVQVQMFDETLRGWRDQGVIVTDEDNLDYDEHQDVLVFTNRPELPVEFFTAYLAESTDPDFPWFQDFGDEREQTSLDQWRDLSYNTESLAYTYADDDLPLGDLNWFPEKKAEWEQLQSVDAEEEPGLPEHFQLVGNYPNPFNPTTDIVYDVATPAEFTLHVYNVLGQRVETIALGQQAPGRHHVTFEAHGLSSGVYIIQMQAEGQVQSIPITLLK